MKQLLIILIMALPFGARAQTGNNHHPQIFKMPPAAPGLDSYAIKQYYFVMLTTGPRSNDITDTAVINKLQDDHLVNIGRLAKEGKILVAGPFGDDGNWQGIFIFDCETKEEVVQLLATDPMIKAGRLSYELHPWWTGMNAVFK